MGSIRSELNSIVQSELSKLGSRGAVDVPNSGYFATALKAELISNINSADMPQGVKNALINGISVIILGSDRAVVSVSAIRPSIYEDVTDKYDSVDLALIYDQRKAIKQSAVYYNNDIGYSIPIGKIPGFARGYTNNYLQKTANAFMTKHPECIVTVTR